ncbi:MAG: hypothetical protein ACJ75B_04885 [Flavisolibacter sp.]
MLKKILGLLLLVIVAALALIYLFIPSEIEVSASTGIFCTEKNVNDCVHDTAVWKRWWPADEKHHEVQNHLFRYNGDEYLIKQPLANGAEIQLTHGNTAYPTKFMVLPGGKDSALVIWSTGIHAGRNPLSRLSAYFKGKEIQDNLESILAHLHDFAQHTENLYGFPIERTTFTDTVLLATRFSTSSYPDLSSIYAAIHDIRVQIARAGAVEKDHPMLNVHAIDSNHYETMVAICTDRMIDAPPPFFLSRMVAMKDRFLKTEVQGGPGRIRQAHEAVIRYMEDHFLSQPAIPFEILVTERNQEKDSSKWKTVIFYPSM